MSASDIFGTKKNYSWLKQIILSVDKGILLNCSKFFQSLSVIFKCQWEYFPPTFYKEHHSKSHSYQNCTTVKFCYASHNLQIVMQIIYDSLQRCFYYHNSMPIFKIFVLSTTSVQIKKYML